MPHRAAGSSEPFILAIPPLKKPTMPIYDPQTQYLPRDGSEGIFERYDPPPENGRGSPLLCTLDPEQKTDEKPPQRPLERDYVFRKYVEPHERLEHWLLTRCPDEPLKRRVLACGTDAWVDYSRSTNAFRIRAKQCGWRGCPRCRTKWAIGIREKITSVTADVAPGRRKLATLTLRSSNAPLRQQVTYLWRSYAKLRQRKLWKDAVRGSVAILEVTYNGERKQWHPHLHCVLDASFLDQKKLSKQWMQVTLGSKIVDVRSIKDFSSVPAYLAKYLLKVPTLPVGVPPETEDELYTLWNRMRIARFHGSMRPRHGEEIWRPDYAEDWEPVTTLHRVLELAACGDALGLRIVEALNPRAFDPDLVKPP
jgi:hypothetical protein